MISAFPKPHVNGFSLWAYIRGISIKRIYLLIQFPQCQCPTEIALLCKVVMMGPSGRGLYPAVKKRSEATREEVFGGNMAWLMTHATHMVRK